MAGSAGSIYVDLLLRDANYRQGWNRARGYTKQGASQISGDVNKIGQSFTGVINPVNNLGSALRNLSGIIAGAFSVQRIVQYADTWRQLEGRLNIVAGEFGNVAQVQQQLFEVAQRTRQPLEGIMSFYSRLAQFIPEAERAQYDLLGVTESVSAALAITGETSASATGAMIQFTQAIGTNFEAAGQELRSLQEQAPRLTQALMKALGDGTKSLQQLKDEGKLTRESVLNALSGMGEEGRRLQEELAKVPLTVGQAFARLDNAFLKFIGQSREVSNVTGGVALVISTLAENLNIVANAVISISAFFAGKLIASLVSSSVAWVRNTQEIIRYNNALRLQAVLNGQAIASTSALSVASTRFVALLGGPVVAGITLAATALFGYKTALDQTRQVSFDFLAIGGQIKSLNIELANASKARTKEIIKERDALLSKAQAEIADTQALIKKYEIIGKISGGPFGLGLGLASGKFENAARDRLAAQIEELNKLNNSLNDYINNGIQNGPVGSASVENEKSIQKKQKELQSLYQKNRELILGVDTATLKYNDTIKELNDLLAANIITDGQFNEALNRLNDDFDKNREKVNDWGIDVESFSKKAAENIQDSFAEFLFDPFQEGVDGMLKGFVDTVRKMIAEAQAARLAQALFGENSGGKGSGLLGGVLDSLGGIFGGGSGFNPATSAPARKPIQAFADGGYLGPGQFGIAGEAGAELLYGGKTGVSVFNQDQIGGRGTVYQIDARGTDPSVVRRIEQSLMALAGPGVIESRVSNAQTRGSLS